MAAPGDVREPLFRTVYQCLSTINGKALASEPRQDTFNCQPMWFYPVSLSWRGITASFKMRKIWNFCDGLSTGRKSCLHGRSSHLIPICSWRTFRCQYGKVKDVIGLCFSETNRVRSLLDMASAHVVGNGWYSDRQSELSSLDMFFELENSSQDLICLICIPSKIQSQAFHQKKRQEKARHL